MTGLSRFPIGTSLSYAVQNSPPPGNFSCPVMENKSLIIIYFNIYIYTLYIPFLIEKTTDMAANLLVHSNNHRHVTFDIPDVPYRLDPQFGNDEAPPATVLANTLAYLDGDAGIPYSLLARAGRPLRTWDSKGEPVEVTPEESGIEPALLDILSSIDRLHAAVDRLKLCGVLAADNNGSVLLMHAGTRAVYKQGVHAPSWYMVQAIMLVCHSFPRDRFIDEKCGLSLFCATLTSAC